MENIKLLYDYNPKFNKKKHPSIFMKNGKLIVAISNEHLDFETVKTIISDINYIRFKYPSTKIPIIFSFFNIKLVDKLSFVLLECIFQLLIMEFGHKVEVYLEMKNIIITEGINSSPLLILANANKSLAEKNKKFLEKFNNDHFKYHFRRVLKSEDMGTDKLSKIYDEIAYFQKSFNINYDCIEEVSEVIVELIGNALEHSESDCLVDFDIATDYKNKNEESVCALNIVILNFSKILLGDKLCEKIINSNFDDESEGRYKLVEQALSTHNSFFDDVYDKKDFFNISTFQNKISGRNKITPTGGTGLTKLIKSIEDKSEAHSCYVITGDRKIYFEPNYLEYKDDWIGFNQENDYFNHKPFNGILKRNSFFMPGTAYNLNFIMKVNIDE